MKRLFLFFLILIMTACACISLALADNISYYYDGAWHPYVGNVMKLTVNGKAVSGEMPPIIFSDRSVVPAREVFQMLGADVLWNERSETVTISYLNTVIKLVINSKTAKINSKEVEMEIPAKLINGKTMIPARFVAENLGMEVGFDTKTDTIIINNKPESTKEPEAEKNGEVAVLYEKYETNAENLSMSIRLKTDKKAETNAFVLTEPSRIVVDVLSGSFASLPSEIEVGKGNVNKIRFGNQKDSARIVVDISENLGYNVKCEENYVIIEIKMSSVEEKKTDILSTATYRKQGTIDAFESPYEILNTELLTSENKLKITVNTNGETGENSSKAVNTLYAEAIAFEQTEKEEGKFIISLKNSKVRFNVSGEKIVYIKSEIAPLKKSVMLDAGHGGSDPGAVYTDENGNVMLKEKDLNLAVTLKVKDILEKNGVEVNLIRSEDIYVDFLKVGSIANSVGSTLFVSIHTNSFTNTEVNGIEVYGYLSGGTVSNGMSSEQLSNNLLNGLIDETGANNRGVRDGKSLAVVNSTKAPAALVEIGFITNKEEREKMETEEYKQKLAQGIANGILKSFEEMEIK